MIVRMLFTRHRILGSEGVERVGHDFPCPRIHVPLSIFGAFRVYHGSWGANFLDDSAATAIARVASLFLVIGLYWKHRYLGAEAAMLETSVTSYGLLPALNTMVGKRAGWGHEHL